MSTLTPTAAPAPDTSGVRPPLDIPGVRPPTAAEIRLQRRLAVVFTVGPLLGLGIAVALLWGGGLSGLDLGLLIGGYLTTGLGVTVGFHRLFTHRSFDAPTPVRVVLAVAGSLALQGSVIDWVATHRRHHAYADREGDPHSPHLTGEGGWRGALRGLWHAHVGWMTRPDGTLPERWAPDLLADPAIRRVDRAWPVLAVATFLVPPLVGGVVTGTLWGAVTAFVWGSLVRIALLHHVTWSINSICHFFGDQPFDTGDESTNNWPLSLLSFGESWHNNHHAFPSSARHGLLRWQPDPSFLTIRLLAAVRLARRIRLPSAEAMARRWRHTAADLERRLPRGLRRATR